MPRRKLHTAHKGEINKYIKDNKFMSKYAKVTQPLLKLLKKDTKFKWNEELECHFNRIKGLFINTVLFANQCKQVRTGWTVVSAR